MPLRARLILLSALAVLPACTRDRVAAPTTAPVEPIGLQILRAHPHLKSDRFSVLLDFEADPDLVFVTAGTFSARYAHTGHRALAARGNVTVRLAPLLGPRAFPGDWTLAGAHVRPSSPANITLKYVSASGKTLATRETRCAADQWTPLFVEVCTPDGDDPAVKSAEPPGDLVIESPVPLLVDDVLLVDNTRVHVAGKSAWTVRRRGYSLLLDRPGVFHMVLPLADGDPETGWRLDDATPVRARLSRPRDRATLTVYNDGRAFRSDDSPPPVHGTVSVPDHQGRLDRTDPADADNDAFVDPRGAYRVVARGGSLDVTLTPPPNAALDQPVLEIVNLPDGPVRATVEGRPVRHVAREGDTTVLITPARVERPTTINIRVD